ncbi:glycosyltransferase, partial [Bartonella sp. CL63NXGY]|uniref:glycosyltransferase n=1 Tax=Bartonella sp. CL63NXGY TaxID=3243538 RepID=UPI0035D06707
TETLIKSIAYHNTDLTICILNDALPQEWFANLRQRLQSLRIEIRDIKIDSRQIANEQLSIGNITKMTYARFMIPQCIPEARVLYLDNDTIVQTDLDDLFNIDMQGHAIGVVKEALSPD